MSFDAPPPPPTGPSGNASNDKTMATLAHALGAITGFLGPLIIMVTSGNNSAYVRREAVEALNFQITIAIAWVACFVLSLVLVGALLMPIVAIVGFVFPIIGAVKVNGGETYTYPFALRLIN